MNLLILVVGAVSAAILVGAWGVYPHWVSKKAETVPIPRNATSHPDTRLTVIVATREPAEVIARRVADLRSGDYPAQLLDIVVALDHSQVAEMDRVQSAVGTGAVVVPGDPPGGKASALNAGVRAAKTEFLAFADSAQVFDRSTLSLLVRYLEEGTYGAVTAQLAPTSGDPMMDIYWRRELGMRKGQAARHSIICVTGCAYAMKKSAWVPIPENTICDDLWVTYSHVFNGLRVGIAPEALVTDPRRFSRQQEYSRRLRTMTGLFQFITRMPRVLSPVGNPMFVHFVLHKAVRLITPILAFFVLLALVRLITLWEGGAKLVLVGLAVCTLLLLLRYRFAFGRLVSDLSYAFRLATIPFHALWFATRGDWNVWRRHSGSTGT